MARRPEEHPLHTLTAESYNDSQHILPLYAPEARVHELAFKHPQITGYRALVLTLTAGFGIPKAVLMFLHRNNPAYANAATSLDFAFTAICGTAYVGLIFYFLYWLGLYEESHPPWMRRWLFTEKYTETQTTLSLGNENEWHHPRLTTYRFVVLALPILFGSWKAGLTYKGQSTTPNMLEWQFGVVGIIWLFWLGWFEECHPEWMHPNFAEDDKAQRVPKRYPGFTVYRVLVIVVIASFGISNAALTSKGEYVGANWIDVVLGVICISGLFWLGLYQRNCSESWRWFFIKEYCSALCIVPAVISILLVRTAPFTIFAFAINHFFVDMGWLSVLIAVTSLGPLMAAFCVIIMLVAVVVCLPFYFVYLTGFFVQRRLGAVQTQNQ